MELEPDFRIEETRLLSRLRQAGEAELVQRILNDHETYFTVHMRLSMDWRKPPPAVKGGHT